MPSGPGADFFGGVEHKLNVSLCNLPIAVDGEVGDELQQVVNGQLERATLRKYLRPILSQVCSCLLSRAWMSMVVE